VLRTQHGTHWHEIITVDESWLHLNTDHGSPELPPDKKFPERERHTFQSGKLMLMIVWNPTGFYVINVLSKGIKFNADHYIANVLTPLVEWHKTQVGRTNRKLIGHTDNARLHTAKMSLDFLEQNGMKKHLTHRTHLI
jgi:hypothetical protein